MKIVCLDGHTLNPGDNPWDDVAELGDLTIYDRTPRGHAVERARGAGVVLTNKTQLDRDAIAALESVRLIAVLATGYNVVDIEAARERGIVVCNVPEYGSDSVAQHTWGLILGLANGIAAHDRRVHEGAWQRSEDFCFWDRPPLALAGLTLGVVGFGRIGRRVAELGGAFGMRVLATRRRQPPDPRGLPVQFVHVEELFAQADVITLHCPLTENNKAFVNDDLLARTKRGALLINTARGGLIDEPAARRALDDGRLGGLAVDVVAREPMPADHPWIGAPNCILTPHIAWASLQARRRLMSTTAENIRAFLAGRPVNVVT